MAIPEDDAIGLKQGEDFYLQVREKSLYTIIERISSPIITFLISVYIIRSLSVTDYGIYSTLLAIMGYVALFSSFGLANIFERFIPEFARKKEIAMLKKLVDKSLLLRFFVCFVIVLLMLIFAKNVGLLFKLEKAFDYLLVFALGIIFFLQTSLLSKALISIFRQKELLIAQLIYVFIRGIVLFFLLHLGAGLRGLLLGESIAYGVLYFMYQYYYQRFLKKSIIKDRGKLPLKRLLRFGGFSYFNEAGQRILSVSTDYLIIAAILGPQAVGIYGFATRIMQLATRIMPHVAFANIIRPVFFSRYVQDDNPEQLKKMFKMLLKMIAFISFPVTFGIILLGDKLIIYVFDAKYLESLDVLWIAASFFLVNSFRNPVELVLQSLEKVNIIFYSKVFAVYNLVLNLIVVKPYGIIGVALVTGSAVLFNWIFCYYFAKKYVPLSLDLKRLIVILMNCIIMVLPLLLLKTFVHNIISFVLIICLGAAVYLTASFFNKSFSQEERDVINRVLPKPIFVF